jgi:predicted RNA-binding Zn ribbon-like protein
VANELESATFYRSVPLLKGRRGPRVTKYAIVTSNMKLYQWYPGNSDTDDSDTNADTIAATGGDAGRWKTIAYIPTEAAISAGMLRTTAHTEADWYVDADNGNDTYDGLTESTPLATFAELGARINANVIDGASDVPTVTVHVLSDITEDIELYVRVRNAGALLITDDRDVADRSIASYPITGRTNWSEGTYTEGTFTCSAIPTTIAALPSGGGVGYQAIITASATADNVGASTWVVAETSAKTALHPGWWQESFFDVVDAAVGDTVAFCRLRKLSGLVHIEVEGNGRVTFEDLELGTDGEGHSVSASRGTVYFNRCLVHGLDVGINEDAASVASVKLISSRTHNGCRTRQFSQATLWATCHTRSVSSALNCGGLLFVEYRCLVYQNAVVVDPTGELIVEGSLSVYGATVGLEANTFSRTWVYDVMWGHNITTTFLRLQRCSRVVCSSGGLAITGTSPTNAYSLAGTSSASLTLPAGAGTSTSIEVG